MPSGFNHYRRYAALVLKKHNIPFSMPELPADRVDPIELSSGKADLARGQIGLYRFLEDSPRDARGMLSPIRQKGAGRVRKGAFENNGEYINNRAGYIRKSRNANWDLSPDFTISLNFYINPKARNRQNLMTVWDGIFDLSFFGERLAITPEVYWKQGNSGSYNYARYFYELKPKVNRGRWHHLSMSLSAKQGRIALMLNGKRLPDIRLQDRFLNRYRKTFQNGQYLSNVVQFYNYRFGSVLNGRVDDIAIYKRPLSTKEMRLLYKSYAKNTSSISDSEEIVIPDPGDPRQNGRLIRAAHKGNLRGVRDALGKGASVDFQYKGWSALMYAAWFGYDPIVRLLISKRANAMLSDGKWTALKLAEAAGHKKIYRLLDDYSNNKRFYFEKSLSPVKSRAIILPPSP